MLSEKLRLTESFILKGKIESVSKINYDLIRNHLFSNYSLANKFEDEQYWYMKDYLKVPYQFPAPLKYTKASIKITAIN